MIVVVGSPGMIVSLQSSSSNRYRIWITRSWLDVKDAWAAESVTVESIESVLS